MFYHVGGVKMNTRRQFEQELDDVVNTALTEGKFKSRNLWSAVRSNIDQGLNGTQQKEQYYANLDQALAQLDYLKLFPDALNGQMGRLETAYKRISAEKTRIAEVLGYQDKITGDYHPEAKRDCHKAVNGF